VDIADWLLGLALEKYAPAFDENAINRDVVSELTTGDLKEIGVAAVGDRRRLLAAIAALGRGRRGRHFGNSFGNRCGGQFGDGIAQAQPMARARHANVFQHLIIDLGEQISVNVVGFEGVGRLGETDLLEPIPYCAHAASSSRSAFASLRSWVSKPSVNQP